MNSLGMRLFRWLPFRIRTNTVTDRPKTLSGVLDAAGRYLTDKRIPDARRIAGILISTTTGIPLLELSLRGNTLLTEVQLEILRTQTRRAASGEPVQYILGEWDVFGRTFTVDNRALIPRRETEGLVEWVLAASDIWDPTDGQSTILDVGTGSGCIIITLALAHPEAAYLAVDVSTDALSLAKENAIRHGVGNSVVFSNQDLSELLEPASLSGIVANLPYISSAECDRLSSVVREFEPRLALDGGPDGLEPIRNTIEEAAILLRAGGRIFLEIGADQGDSVVGLLEDQGFLEATIRQDLSGRDRMASARQG
jgi:release factor glutamine methyltransferase